MIAITGIAISLNSFANDKVIADTSLAPEVKPYIVGGVDGKALELPWQVYIEIIKDGNTYACGGTLITDTWVVTAAHCLNGQSDQSGFFPVSRHQVTVYTGGIDRSFRGDMVKHTVTTLSAFPLYDAMRNTGDIALLQLSSPAVSPAQPIKLMDSHLQIDADIEFDAATENNLILSGWGRTSTDGTQSTDTLQKVALNGVSDHSCALAWGWPQPIDSLICANAFNRGSCSGDSGGPLIWQDKNAKSDNDLGYRLAGVVSFGNSRQCALNILPDAYTQVSSFIDWIQTEINKTGFYQAPEPSFTQDIFTIDNNRLPMAKEGGGIGYSFLLMLTGLLFFRRKP
ncbi:serine protease [Moritella sp. 24]|nr:serine protease [Moritella sp. 24]